MKPLAKRPPNSEGRGWVLGQLDADAFADRAKASADLEQFKPPARQALQGDLSAEARRRLEKLLSNLEKAEEADWLPAVRVLEALEHAATPEARQFLTKLASGAAGARLTREAKATLERLARR